MLVRNPKKRPSASKMLWVGSFIVVIRSSVLKKNRIMSPWFGACSSQHVFMTQQCLNRELILDLLEKFRNPEKIKTCLVTEDDDMEVHQCLLFLLSA